MWLLRFYCLHFKCNHLSLCSFHFNFKTLFSVPFSSTRASDSNGKESHFLCFKRSHYSSGEWHVNVHVGSICSMWLAIANPKAMKCGYKWEVFWRGLSHNVRANGGQILPRFIVYMCKHLWKNDCFSWLLASSCKMSYATDLKEVKGSILILYFQSTKTNF